MAPRPAPGRPSSPRVIPVTTEFAEAEISFSSAMQNGACGRAALSPGSRPLPWYRSQTDRPGAPRFPFLAAPAIYAAPRVLPGERVT